MTECDLLVGLRWWVKDLAGIGGLGGGEGEGKLWPSVTTGQLPPTCVRGK